jgi:hypothetical protein
MAEENWDRGYRRIQGALSNLGHNIGRSTIAAVLQRHGIEPVPERSRKRTWKEFQRENRPETPAIGSERASDPSPISTEIPRGDATPARMLEGSGSSENLLEAMEMMRLWVLAFFRPWNGPVIPEQATDLRATNLI